ncbi:adenylylsulfate kinase-like enzyme [Paraburkholderia atlantica]|uniref:adenylyl-sulfate kinase n=1 Tax=Paraburkholderia atlantica TaxID=2654982 RepID=UPI003D1DDEAB
MKVQRPLVVWFTGMSGAGKSTLARMLDEHLYLSGLHTMLLDGGNLLVRAGAIFRSARGSTT